MLKLLMMLPAAALVVAGLALAEREADAGDEHAAYAAVLAARAAVPEAQLRGAAAIVSRWQATPPSAVARREVTLWWQAVTATAAPPPVVDEGLAAASRRLIAAAPLSAVAWCGIADAAWRRGGDPGLAIAGTARCKTAGPREAELMVRRLQLSALAWSILPAESRADALDDLDGLVGSSKLGNTFTDRLARFIVHAVPERADDFAPVIERQSDSVRLIFEHAMAHHSARAGRRPSAK